MGPEAARRLNRLSPMWIMVSGPYPSRAVTAEARARNLAELNRAARALFRAGHVPVIGVNRARPRLEAVPVAR